MDKEEVDTSSLINSTKKCMQKGENGTAIELLEQAMKLEDVQAILLLAKVYSNGSNEDREKSLSYYEMACKYNSALAFYKLGKAARVKENQNPETTDYKESFTLFSKASKLGHAKASRKLYKYYATGLYVLFLKMRVNSENGSCFPNKFNFIKLLIQKKTKIDRLGSKSDII